jgi:DNA-binding GntR family transcriptional regulator
MMRKFQTMTEFANQELRKGIINGRYLPGSRLKPVQLEQDLGLGRVAIREALRELTGSGLVQSIPNKGIQVTMPPSPEEMATIFESRCILEGDLGLQAVSKITPAIIEQLEHLYEKMENKELFSRDRFLINREFHLTLYRASTWDHSCRIVAQILDQILVFYAFHAHNIKLNLDFKPFNKEHAVIIEGLKSKNGQKVQKTIVANIRHGYKVLRKVSSALKKAV